MCPNFESFYSKCLTNQKFPPENLLGCKIYWILPASVQTSTTSITLTIISFCRRRVIYILLTHTQTEINLYFKRQFRSFLEQYIPIAKLGNEPLSKWEFMTRSPEIWKQFLNSAVTVNMKIWLLLFITALFSYGSSGYIVGNRLREKSSQNKHHKNYPSKNKASF